MIDPLAGHFFWLGHNHPPDPFIDCIRDCWESGKQAPEPKTNHERKIHQRMHPSYGDAQFRDCQIPPVEPPVPTPTPLSVEQQERLIFTLQSDERFRPALRGVLNV